jgi:ERCC4-type nuclease
VQVVTDDGHTLIIERKTADDLLNSLKDERLFPQMTRITEQRIDQQMIGLPMTVWPYLVVTGELRNGPNGKAVTDRGTTGWAYSAIQGALLSIQEMGVFVAQCAEMDFEQTIIRLADRRRDEAYQKILPPRPGLMLGPSTALLAALPGIGPDRAVQLMQWAGSAGFALAGLTDPEVDCPVGKAIQRRVRQVLGLEANQYMSIWANDTGETVLKILEKEGA